MTHWPGRGLYLLTPDDTDTARLVERVAAVLPHVALLQYRNKLADAALRREQASALLPLCRRYGIALIVNDDWRMANEVGADGAHLGEHDGDLCAARAVMPDAILGASCYDDQSLAAAAVANGASYVAFGAFFPSQTKPGARRAHAGLLRDAVYPGIARVAIGGITPDNAGIVVDAGADYVAVIGGVFDAPDPVEAARAYAAAFHA